MRGFNLSAVAVRERGVTLFFIVAISLAGLYAFLQLGRAEDPVFTIKVLTVSAAWPGATAQEMQDLVADPLEKRLQELRWYDRVETFTRPGLALMTLTLKDAIPPADVPEQFYQARKKLGDEAANLPRGVLGPFVNDEYGDVVFAIYALKAHGMPPRLLTREAESLRQDLLHVAGVQKVNILGERPERIFVDVSNAKLVSLGVAARDIFAALARQNAVAPAGAITTLGPQITIRLDGAYSDLDEIRDTPIEAGGRTLHLSDIATVRRGYEDPPAQLVRHDGEPALLLSVVMQVGWNGLELGRALETESKHIAEALPIGISFSKVSDQAVNIRELVDEFMLKFFVALTVVMAVSLISLGWRVGIVVAAAVPLTLAAVFVIMLATGRVFDRITLGALILALGLLVDDAIIAIEIMLVRLAQGSNRIEAASYAWSHTAAPMLAGTLVTIIGLMPVGFAKSTAGEYAGNIFWIVGYALLASWVVAVVFTPYLGVALLPAIRAAPGGHSGLYQTPRYRRLRRLIEWAVRRRRLVVGGVVGLFVLSGVGMLGLKQQFFPSSDRPEVLVEVQMPEGSSITGTSAAAARVEAWLTAQPEARVVTTYVGSGAARFYLGYNPELPDPAFAKLIVQTPDPAARDVLTQRLRTRIADGLAPEARLRVTQLVFGPPSPFPVAFRVMGPDVAQLRAIAARVEGVMRANPHMRDVNEDWSERVPGIHFVLDQDRLRRIGLSPGEVSDQLQFLLSGTAVSQFREDIRTADIVARAAGDARLNPALLGDLSLTTQDGHLMPLSQLGRIEVRPEEPILRRRDRTPTITVRGDIDAQSQPPGVSAQISRALQPIIAALPPGIRIETGGSVEEAGKANAALLPVMPIMVLLILTVIVLQVRSISAMILVFLTAPLGLVGAVPMLLLADKPFGFNAILGLIGLSGILMRNTLILIGQIRTNTAEGLDPYQAVVEATVQRARPVILTALAAVLAFIPLTTSAFWGPMALTLIGGTAVGTVLVLAFLPALYALWFRVRQVDPARQRSEWSGRPAVDADAGSIRLPALPTGHISSAD